MESTFGLITIFGNNFNTGTAVAATVDSFGRYPSTLVVPTGGSNSLGKVL